MLKRGTHELEIHEEKMYNHFLAWENKSSPISFVINYRTRFLYLAFNLSSCETNYWFRTWLHIFLMHSVSCAALYASIFTIFFFRLGYRPILDAMKTFAKSENPIDIEVRTRLHFNHIWLAHHWFSMCPDRFVFTEW